MQKRARVETEYVVTPKRGKEFVSKRKLDAIYEHVKYKRGEAVYSERRVEK